MDVCSGMFIGTMMLPTGTDHEEPVMRYGVATLVFCAAIAGVFSTRPAGAVKPFLEQFKALYERLKEGKLPVGEIHVRSKDASQ